jgi:lysylphosphatidylglycerol synthetase-like protein (DUF2156 family)
MRPSQLTTAQRLALLRRYGRHPQAWATLQPGITYIDVDTEAGQAYVATRTAFLVTIVLGDPIGAPAAIDAVLERVLSSSSSVLFFQVSEDVAMRLRARHGLRTTPLGIEPVVDVASFSLRGRQKQALRSARNHADRKDIVVEEVDVASLDEAPALRWRDTRRRRRLGFIVPPLRLAKEAAVAERERRAFVAKAAGEALGFVVFDPLYEDGQLVGVTPSVSCASTRFRPGLWYVLVTAAILRFQREGLATVNLGLAPLVALPPSSMASLSSSSVSATILRAAFALLSRVGLLYNFRGIAHAKSRFGGTPRSAWLGHRGALPVRALLALWWVIATDHETPSRPTAGG